MLHAIRPARDRALMPDMLGWLLDLVRSVDPVTRILLSGLAMACETSVLLGVVVPGDTVVLVSSTATSNLAEYLGLLAAVIVGSLLGESFGFWLGRVFGPRLRGSWLGRRIGLEHWDRAERYLARRGGPAIFISRFLPVLHSLIPLTVGTSPMRYRRFLAWTAPACVVWASAYVTVGWLAGSSYETLSKQLSWAGYVFAGALLLFLALAWLLRRALHRREARHMDEPAREPGPPDQAG